MTNDCITISSNNLKKSLPDVAYNSREDTFFVFWAASPGDESETADYFIAGQKLSGQGTPLGGPVELVKTENIALRPVALYNPNKNQYLLVYCLGEDYMNLRGVILDANGKAVGNHFRVTDAPANQVHYTMAFNSRRNQFLITYNDNRNGPNKVFGIIFDDQGGVAKQEFIISNAPGHQINPVVCYNPAEDTYLINWEDFRAHGDGLTPYGTLEVMTDIYGALLAADGTVLVNNIPMCADAGGSNGDQRFNGIAYSAKKNEFLTSWTDSREGIHNVGIVGRIVKPDGAMPAQDFVLVDEPGAQMISHSAYLPQQDKYFIAFEYSRKELEKFYFKDINARLDIGARWLGADGRPEGDVIDICSREGNQRFVRFAHNVKGDTFLLVWQDDFPGVSDSVEGHIMSAGGDIMGALYKK